MRMFFGLDIPVDDWGALPMEVGEGGEALAYDFQALSVGQGEPSLQSSPKDGLEMQLDCVARRVNQLENAHDVFLSMRD